MRPGLLRQKVTLQRGTLDDPSFSTKMTWEDVGTYYAQVSMINGTETQFANQQRAVATFKVVMRYREVLPTDRLLYNDRALQIVSINNLNEANIWLEIQCTEVM